MEFSDEELSAELARRKDLLDKKRNSSEIAAALEAATKRARMISELREIHSELDMSMDTSSSSASSSSSSSSIPIMPQPLAEPKPKNNMFTYWAAKNNNVIDVEALVKRRADDAKLNSESRQSESHRERRVAVGSQNNTKVMAADRMCSNASWLAAKKKLKGQDLLAITYQIGEKRIWCSACPCFVRDDNLDAHVVTCCKGPFFSSRPTNAYIILNRKRAPKTYLVFLNY
jgi:hypothetical protein